MLLVSPDYYDQEPEIVHKDLFSALGGLPEALGDTGEVCPRRRNRRSISVHLDSPDFDLDIVPVVALDGLDEPLKIPDRNLSKWVDTHPFGYASMLSDLNSQHQEKVVRLVKLLKHWRDVNMTYLRPKSYWLECMVYHLFADGKLSGTGLSYAELFRDLLEAMYETFRADFEKDDAVPEILDPALGKSITNWERPAFERFMRCVDETARRANRALDQDDEVKAVELWEDIFGTDYFPSSAAVKRALQLQTAALSGSIYIAPTGRVETTKPDGRSVQSPPQRFYGGD